DHGPHGFVGGGYLGAVQTNGRPLQSTRVPKGTPRWGREWKQAVAKSYLSSYQAVTHGGCCSYRDAYFDLDPTYTDRFGRKLMRITFDFHENELKMSQYLTDRLAEVVQKMGPRQFEKKSSDRRGIGMRVRTLMSLAAAACTIGAITARSAE